MLFLMLCFCSLTSFSQATLVPTRLSCEMQTSPVGIDVSAPRFGYTLEVADEGVRGVTQRAYQIEVAEDRDFGSASQLWNSGKVSSDQMSFITYKGKALQTGQRCWWRVRVWDGHGVASAWSKPASFVMGVMDTQDWQASWISAAGAEKYAHNYKSARRDFNLKRDIEECRQYLPSPKDPNFSSMLVRKRFKVKPKLRQAIIFISGLGQYELSVNGEKVGDQLLTPGLTDYHKTVLYDSYDLTKQLKTGDNAIGVMLSNGIYNIMPDSVRYVKFLSSFGPLKMIASLKLTYADGSVQTVATDKSWKVTTGPITYSNFFGGEDYDANLELASWNKPAFDDHSWGSALECSGPGGALKGLSCGAPAVKAIQVLSPAQVTKLRPDLYVYDLGQNASIMPELKVKGAKGAFVRIIPSELIKADGTVDRSSVCQGPVVPAWWQYTMKSTLSEAWMAKFFYQGARYLQVELHPAPGDTALPVIESLKGVVVHASSEPVGAFSCSNELFNRIYDLVRWAQRSNMMSIMTDCPAREKQGWLEELHLNGPALRYNFDMAQLYRKEMNDMADAQLSSGLIPNIAPEFFQVMVDPSHPFRNSPEWGSSFIIVPWQQYLFTGDRSLMRDYFTQMQKYLAFLDSTAKDNIVYTGLGDWYDIGPKPGWGSQLTPEPFTATAIYYYDQLVMSKMAKLLGLDEAAAGYQTKAEAVKKAFNDKFYDAEKGCYATGSNTTYAMPLWLDLASENNRDSLLNHLIRDIRSKGNTFTSGEVGYRFLLGALQSGGAADLIYDMNNQTDRPGYGYELKKGATALTEKWDAGGGSAGSQNHFMSGQINEWLFDGLAGIGSSEKGAGFRDMIIKPAVVGDLTWVKASYQAISGLVKVHWERKDKAFGLHVSIPANCAATIYVPAVRAEEVLEAGKSLQGNKDIELLGFEKGLAICRVQSGNYYFQSTLPY